MVVDLLQRSVLRLCGVVCFGLLIADPDRCGSCSLLGVRPLQRLQAHLLLRLAPIVLTPVWQ